MRYALNKHLKEYRNKKRMNKTRTKLTEKTPKHGFNYTANVTTTTQNQSDYKVEQSSLPRGGALEKISTGMLVFEI